MEENDESALLLFNNIGLNVVIEDESDYVFVADRRTSSNCADDDEMEGWDDDEEWDDCNVSPSLSCVTSVATDVTLIEDSIMDDADEEEEKTAEPMDTTTDDKTEKSSGAPSLKKNFPTTTTTSLANPKNGRRLSNKKLKKKMKMLKKIAAAKAAAAEAEAAAAKKVDEDASEKKQPYPELFKECAREETIKLKKTRAVSIDGSN